MVMVSTRGRYALRIMLDLAQHNTGEYITLMDIASRQGISEKYLESIIASLSRSGFLMTLRGRGGGYRLARDPSEITVCSILKEAETTFAPVACLEKGAQPCARAEGCLTLPLWTELQKVIDNFLGSVSLADLLEQETAMKASELDSAVSDDTAEG